LLLINRDCVVLNWSSSIFWSLHPS